MGFAADHGETLEFLLTSVDLAVGSLGSTEKVHMIFEILPCSMEHVRWNSRNPNSCSESTALDITPQEKNPVVLCLVNVEAKALEICAVISLSLGD
jgi:hypothetical protein